MGVPVPRAQCGAPLRRHRRARPLRADNPPPPLPLVISPHGRGVRAITNARLWRDLPGRGGFAVVCPGGMGRRLPLHSWGWRGQIDDLARMPAILRATRPWLRIDRADLRRRRKHGRAGDAASARPAPAPARRCGRVRLGDGLRAPLPAVRAHAQGTDAPGARPGRGGRHAAPNPRAYVLRSPQHWLREIAESGVPLQLWWSDADEIVVDQGRSQGGSSGSCRLEPRGRLEKVTGSWSHTAESYTRLQLPGAVAWLGLVPDAELPEPRGRSRSARQPPPRRGSRRRPTRAPRVGSARRELGRVPVAEREQPEPVDAVAADRRVQAHAAFAGRFCSVPGAK